MELKAERFKSGGEIPKEFTCDGVNASPGVSWTQPRAGTQSFVLIMDDPVAPAATLVHWVVYNVPANARQLSEATPQRDELIDGTRQAINDFGKPGYSGPCPPPGQSHRYFLRLYALDTTLSLKGETNKENVQQAMKGHILAQANLMAYYRREPRPFKP